MRLEAKLDDDDGRKFTDAFYLFLGMLTPFCSGGTYMSRVMHGQNCIDSAEDRRRQIQDSIYKGYSLVKALLF
ncbi:MAG TPA: hypothetical protein VD815_07610 [Candidatus Saccharimonadales bacterium]|nr:hypothetical protein [Candidatus Saccharimonadales bacterium]